MVAAENRGHNAYLKSKIGIVSLHTWKKSQVGSQIFKTKNASLNKQVSLGENGRKNAAGTEGGNDEFATFANEKTAVPFCRHHDYRVGAGV